MKQNPWKKSERGVFMTVETTYITIPGLSRSYVFYHTSDAHVACALPEESDEARAIAKKHEGKWSPMGILPVDGFDEALTLADGDHADAIFLCGDIADYYSPGTVHHIRERIRSASTEVLYVCGNHEGADYYKEVEDIRYCYPDYADLMKNSPAFWVRDFGELLVVGVDNGDREIRKEQLEMLEEQFGKGKPILLMMHIPMYIPSLEAPVREKWGENGCDYFTIGRGLNSELTEAFCAAVKRPDNNIAAVFAGHIHLSHSGEFEGGRLQHTSPPSFEGRIRKYIVKGE